MNDPNSTSPSPEPRRETLAEMCVRHDESVICIELLTYPSGRPPSLRVSRTTRSRASYAVIISPTFAGDVLDAVRRWAAIVAAQESSGQPASPRTSPPTNVRPVASSGHGGGR